ncbi:hypothetical protein D3C81_1257560 [compost metagenome]
MNSGEPLSIVLRGGSSPASWKRWRKAPSTAPSRRPNIHACSSSCAALISRCRASGWRTLASTRYSSCISTSLWMRGSGSPSPKVCRVTTASSSRASRLGSSSGRMPPLTWMPIFGQCRRSASTAGATSEPAVLGPVPIRTWPSAPVCSSCSRSSKRRTASWAGWACSISNRPTSVSRASRLPRSNSRAPSCCSSAWMPLLKACWVRPVAAAARVKLPCSTTDRK